MIELHKRSEGQEDKTALPETNSSRKATQSGVILYITILFTVVFLLILLSYFMHSRQSENTITELQEDHAEFRRSAEEEIERLTDENRRLQELLTQAQDRIKELENTQKEGENK
ncbi:MAG: hypothetical protein II794_02475 [Oscillospiraceae bacterium]|nr:hypothetical protein [Oscillospiraceae bacterium]